MIASTCLYNSSLRLIRHYFLIPLKWRIRKILRYKLFLWKWLSTTANIKCTAEWRSQTFYETHILYQLALIHFAYSSSLQSYL